MMSPAMIEALDNYCKEHEITRSTVIREAVREWFNAKGIKY